MGFDFKLDDGDEVMSEINMTPMVDVMLVLLVIFIIAMPLLNHALRIDLPKAQSQASQVTATSITLSVTRNGEIHWNKQPIDKSALQQRLVSAARQQPQPEIHLHADRQIAYEQVVQVMSLVRQAGMQKLGFITLPDGK